VKLAVIGPLLEADAAHAHATDHINSVRCACACTMYGCRYGIPRGLVRSALPCQCVRVGSYARGPGCAFGMVFDDRGIFVRRS